MSKLCPSQNFLNFTIVAISEYLDLRFIKRESRHSDMATIVKFKTFWLGHNLDIFDFSI